MNSKLRIPLCWKEAKADRAAAVYAPLVDEHLLWLIACAIDASLAFGLAGISLVRGSIAKQLKAEAKAKAKKRKPAKATKLPAKKAVGDLPSGFFGRPVLAVDNT